MTKTIIEKAVKGLSPTDETIGVVVATETARLIFKRIDIILPKAEIRLEEEYQELKKECGVE